MPPLPLLLLAALPFASPSKKSVEPTGGPTGSPLKRKSTAGGVFVSSTIEKVCEKTSFKNGFSYVRPEPVLVNVRVLV